METLFYLLYRILNPILEFLLGERDLSGLFGDGFMWWYTLVAVCVSALSFVGLVWVLIADDRLIKDVYEKERRAREGVLAGVNETDGDRRWRGVLAKLASDNPSDWKLAIIEADTILDELVATMNLAGTTLGERLKAIEPSDFLTLNQAWEAHKARNRIAHEVDGVPLSLREARRIITLYEQVFKEFAYISG